jgi:hypothetical protein
LKLACKLPCTQASFKSLSNAISINSFLYFQIAIPSDSDNIYYILACINITLVSIEGAMK